jgi:hypothetical protein
MSEKTLVRSQNVEPGSDPDNLSWADVAEQYGEWHEGLHKPIEEHLRMQGLGDLVASHTSGEQHNSEVAETPPRAPAGTDIMSDTAWDYTAKALHVAAIRQEAERQAGRQERPTIGRDSPILGGVYEGSYGGEAIVVNYETDPELIDRATGRVMAAAQSESGEFDKTKVLDAVFDLVSERMHYDSAAVESIFQNELGGKHHKKVSLNRYIEGGVGECRHQALYAAAILENLSNKGLINGQVSIDRNMIKRDGDDKYDGHAWVRYTNSAGEVYIIDTAQKKIGRLHDLIAARARDPKSTWNYAREEDVRPVVEFSLETITAPPAESDIIKTPDWLKDELYN